MKTQLRQARQELAPGSLFSVLQRTRAGSSSVWTATTLRTVQPVSLEAGKAGYSQRSFIGCAPDASRLRHHPVEKSGAGSTVKVAAERVNRLLGVFRLSGCNAAKTVRRRLP